MIRKQILEEEELKEVDLTLYELKDIITESLKNSSIVGQSFITSMDNRGVAVRSFNRVEIITVEVSCFKDDILSKRIDVETGEIIDAKESLILDINNDRFVLSINEDCNVLVLLNRGDFKCDLLFKDLGMEIILE